MFSGEVSVQVFGPFYFYKFTYLFIYGCIGPFYFFFIYLFIHSLIHSFMTALARFILSICLFMAALGLHCCARAFSSCSRRGLLFVAVRRLLIVVASLVEHGL